MTEFDFPHPTHDSEAMGGPFGGDVCPWCGDALRRGEEGVRATDGKRGDVYDLAADDVAIPVLHPDCYSKWQYKQTARLDEF